MKRRVLQSIRHHVSMALAEWYQRDPALFQTLLSLYESQACSKARAAFYAEVERSAKAKPSVRRGLN